MCGISGFIDFTKNTSKQVLINMTDALIHRGPDDAGYEIYEHNKAHIGFGQRRLSIIDLSKGGHQPMAWQEQGLEIVFNGEIYNYAEIKKELVELGHQFNTQSDTEVILHSYTEWGNTCMHKFIGMFAFVIYDTKKGNIFCCRDRAGVKPLYFYSIENLFLFSSEIKSFHQHPCFEKKIDINGLTQYFTYGYIPSPYTIFEQTQKLEPGHYLEIDLNTKKIKKTQYWNVYDYYTKPKLTINETEAKAIVKEKVIGACNYRMVADVPVGIFLSGGYDSTLVTAAIQTQQTEKLKTFTIGFEEEKYNEANFAKQVANYLGTDHTEYYCTAQEAQNIVADLAQIYDEPYADNSNIPSILVSKLARQKVTVALSADAGDEIFAGYRTYTHVNNVYQKTKYIPIGVQRLIKNTIEGLNVPKWSILKNNATQIQKISNCLPARTILDIHQNLSFVFSKTELNRLLKNNSSSQIFADKEAQQYKLLNELDSLLAYDYQQFMLDDILVKVDKATMSVALEGREPLLDHRLIEYVAQLPNEYKIKNGVNKYLLKEITHDFVPKTIMDRKKMGFTLPVNEWMHTSLKSLLEDTLFSAQQNEYINRNFVDELVRQFYKNPSDKTVFQKIWIVFNFQLWYNTWM